jgi:hypothetical protein
MDYPQGFFAIDTAGLLQPEPSIVTARMKVERRTTTQTRTGRNQVLLMDFDCYYLRWRFNRTTPNVPRERQWSAEPGTWYPLNHNLLGFRPADWKHFGEAYGDFPFAFVCEYAGLINELGDYIGPRR